MVSVQRAEFIFGKYPETAWGGVHHKMNGFFTRSFERVRCLGEPPQMNQMTSKKTNLLKLYHLRGKYNRKILCKKRSRGTAARLMRTFQEGGEGVQPERIAPIYRLLVQPGRCPTPPPPILWRCGGSSNTVYVHFFCIFQFEGRVVENSTENVRNFWCFFVEWRL